MCSIFADILLECCVCRFTVDLEIDVFLARVNPHLVLCILRFGVRWVDALTRAVFVEKLRPVPTVKEVLFELLPDF